MQFIHGLAEEGTFHNGRYVSLIYQRPSKFLRETGRLPDPKPRSREVFTVHRPETIQEWLECFVAGPLADDPRAESTRTA
jgi:hypothetical protein